MFAPAKINLSLDILEKDSSGYHKIKTIFQEIKSIADEIEITSSEDKDILPKFTPPKIFTINPPQQSDDMIYKALTLIKKTFKIKKFVKIKIKKKIPFASGLGGGSSDAAAILKGLNKLWKLKLSKKELAKLGEKLGMDVPFFIYGGTALGTHYGEKITPLVKIKHISFKVKPLKSKEQRGKTQKTYKKLSLLKCGKNLQKTQLLLKGIKTGNKKLILENIHNDFETIIKIPKNYHLSGAGPSIFQAI